MNYLLTGVMFVDAFFFVLTGAALFALRRRAGPWGPSEPARVSKRSEDATGTAPSRSRLVPEAAERVSETDRPLFRTPWYPWVPAFFVLGEIGVVVGSYLDPATRNAAYIGAIWLVVGALTYWLWFRRR